MTVAEVIKELQKYPPDMRVVTPGFDESGLDDVETVKVILVFFNDNANYSHSGRHEEGYTSGDPTILINF